ncbi:peptidoglycan DD-metalloendopeptidase family protein [Massilia agilis]|uniref:Peptidoglycan DD-metalloendopeptidase family protein n=1 Tax=Massilia agilis TaxID=1811226 RepID=A0ABT2D8F8_9BURK|nr:peptidoglycan DD-metalloendopeptidase family protein [Massilia agilis]MCS0807124.1 peptidoglycan DD-metalloendopeptidase family protein [Massilia agilis]
MKQLPRLALLTLTLGLLAACSTPTRQAPVIDRPVQSAHHPVKPAAPAPAPAAASEESKPDARGSYTVRKGDTLLRIALDHGQNYRDIVTWNNLADPDDIKVGQVLRVSPPDRVAGVQTNPVQMPEKAGQTPSRKVVPKRQETNVAEAVKPDRNEKAENVASGPAPGTIVTANDDERLSWMWPANGKIVATFDDGKNKGIDIAGRAGQQVMAAGAGKVMYAGSGIRGYGNLVIVKHSNTLLSAYAHNRAIVVKEGDTVSKGQVIAEMGDTDADSVKLHFEIRQQGKPVDPTRFLPSR